jgi:hypothetical protein
MPMNRIQFQPGVSMPEFFARYGSEDQCAAALRAMRWPEGFAARGAIAQSTTSSATARAGCSNAKAVATRRR